MQEWGKRKVGSWSSQKYKGDDQKAIEKDNDIKERWRERFNKILNEDSIERLGTRDYALLAGHIFYHIIRVCRDEENIRKNEDRRL